MTNTSEKTGAISEGSQTDFSNCHTRILKNFSKLKHLSDWQDFSNPNTQAMIKGLIKYFKKEVWQHHQEEEQELFEAVLDCTHSGPNAELAKEYVDRLIREHRDMEDQWRRVVKKDLRRLARGKSDKFNRKAAAKLAGDYLEHARFEEDVFLPFAEKCLKGTGMSALGLALHLRRAERGVSAYI